jgi:4-hydroxybenzoate polyprenyltransferase
MRIKSVESALAARGAAVPDGAVQAGRPLVVDVDTILVHDSLLTGAALSEMPRRFFAIARLITAAFRGSQALKRRIVGAAHFDPSRLSYDGDIVALLFQVLGQGRPVYLASETYSEAVVGQIARHLGLFTAWSASDAPKRPTSTRDLPGFWDQGFDYLGDDTAVLPTSACRIPRPASRAAQMTPTTWRIWARLLRVHQYAKNALILVPLLTSHQFGFWSTTLAVLAALVFSLAASSAYILNDLLDVSADRAHPSKRNRPIASGAIAPAPAVIVMVGLLTAAVVVASAISLSFLGIVLGYLALTTAYSLRLKRIALADVVTLAILYTIRVVAGAAAIGVTMSEWLFAFSVFIFMSLALVKRYVELRGRRSGERLTARDYETDDLSMIAVLAAAAGFNAVVIFALYISSDTVRALYSHPQALWISCPILMYWIARVMLFAQRGLIDDDPVIFALRDRVSWLALGAIGAIMFAAI